jgi:hypothetical protein
VLAYLDAGSASVAASVVAAGVAGAGVAARSALSKFKRGKKAPITTESETVDADSETAEA